MNHLDEHLEEAASQLDIGLQKAVEELASELTLANLVKILLGKK